MPFVTNEGQVDLAVAYYLQGQGSTAFVATAGEIVYSLDMHTPSGVGGIPRAGEGKAELKGWTVVERFVGGRPVPAAGEGAPTEVSVFRGADSRQWRSGLGTYDSLQLGRVWPGVSVSLRAQSGEVEKLFKVEPGTNICSIRLQLDGVSQLQLADDGSIRARTGIGDVRLSTPVAWQGIGSQRRTVKVAYSIDGLSYGFSLGEYDRSEPVYIDPFLRATYLGGSGDDAVGAIAVHPSTGDLYLAGYAASANFPGTTGGGQPNNAGGDSDAFVARLSPTLTTLKQATYIGGAGRDVANALAIHGSNSSIYIHGFTTSAVLPALTGGAETTYWGGGCDAFVARLTADLTVLQQTTYFGGSGLDQGQGLAIHPSTGEIYIAGVTSSNNIQNATGGAQANISGSMDAYVSRLDSGLTSIFQSTYFGGSGVDAGMDVAIHPATGRVYITGDTNSTNLPWTAGGVGKFYLGGSWDAFISSLASDLRSIVQSTYAGGPATDHGMSLAIRPSDGNVYLGGKTSSTLAFLSGAAQSSFGGGSSDAFVMRYNSALTGLSRSTYFGGNGEDSCTMLEFGPATGDLFAAGNTDSTNIPGTSGAAQPSRGGSSDGFAARLDPTLATLVRVNGQESNHLSFQLK